MGVERDYGFQSGRPFNIGLTGATIGLANRPDVVAGATLAGRRTVDSWFNTAVFKRPSGRGDLGNNCDNAKFTQPGFNNHDLSLFKRFPLKSEKRALEFRWETFNTFNHTNLDAVGGTFGSGTFGQVTSARDPRTMQLGLKFEF
jgi:hypothetical protein